MTIRSYITVDWSQSPRIVNIATESEITIQDLYDSLRDLAAKSEALDDDEIVDAGGKEGGIVAVTLTLYNAQVKFEDTGTPRVCKVSGGNLFAVDGNGVDMVPIAYNNNVTVSYAQSTAAALVGVSGLTSQESQQLQDVWGDVSYVRLKESGRWKIENNQLTFYASDGITILRRFNLFDKQGNPTNDSPSERVPVE